MYDLVAGMLLMVSLTSCNQPNNLCWLVTGVLLSLSQCDFSVVVARTFWGYFDTPVVGFVAYKI